MVIGLANYFRYYVPHMTDMVKPLRDMILTFRKELFSELARMPEVEHSFATAYSKEENGIVERAKSCVTYVPCFLMHTCTISSHSSSYPWYNVL